MSTPTAVQVPASAGLPPGGVEIDGADGPRSGDELITSAAAGEALSDQAQQDLLAYFVANGELPGDSDAHPLEWTIGEGRAKRTNVWHVRRIGWEDWFDAQHRATNQQTGIMDGFIAASYIVARALVRPLLGTSVQDMQKRDGKDAPEDAAALLRRMFCRQPGVLLDLSAEVRRQSKIGTDTASVRTLNEETEAAKT